MMRQAYETNTIAPLFLSKALLPLVRRAADKAAEEPVGVARAAIVMMTSAMASISENTGAGVCAYRLVWTKIQFRW